VPDGTERAPARLRARADVAAVCVEACEKVSESCRAIDESDDQLALCAEVCDHTADCCRQLAI